MLPPMESLTNTAITPRSGRAKRMPPDSSAKQNAVWAPIFAYLVKGVTYSAPYA